ncbi:centromere protein J isoform X3 [Antennarius striatus]|uniref:centromere protein J isoform X3 n=1 Tax=Antennarius striatus TaxID=241820 RepID=UPI0035B021C1
MSSPAGIQFSQEGFLARFLPSSTRAGVILDPRMDLAGSLRHTSAVGSPPVGPDDSFNSSFAPLPASADSSCLVVDGSARSPGGDGAAPDSGARIHPDGELDSSDGMASKSHKSQDLPLMMKLEELRKWQQHMQEQLKAHQLEELIRLQEEHQKLLGVMNQFQDCTEDSREDDQEQSVNPEGHESRDTLTPIPEAELTEDDRTENEILHERPIGGQMKTFEELLEEQLRLEEQRLKSAQQQQGQDGGEAAQAPPKRAFLKRGEGLSRFTSNRKALPPKAEARKDPTPQPQTHVISRSHSEPTAILRGNRDGVPRLPVQRKTATLNKENQLRGINVAPRDISVVSKGARTKVLGSHQRQNTDGSEWIQRDPEGKQNKHPPVLRHIKEQGNRIVALSPPAAWNPDHNTQENPVAKRVGMVTQPEKVGSDTAREKGWRVQSGGGEGGPQDSLEVSFQEKLRRWDCDQRLESMELGEFELLEQAAEELSFSSNSSFVMKVLQMDQIKAARGLHPRRLSSTPIKSPPKGGPGRGSSVDTCKSRSMNSEAFVVRDDTLKNKVSISENEEEESGREEEHGISDISSLSGSECEDREAEVKQLLFATTCFPAHVNPPYDKRSYQDEDGCRDPASHAAAAGDRESDGVFSDADESTFTEDKDGQRDRVVFDDNDTWNDVDDTAIELSDDGGGICTEAASGISPRKRTLVRKVAVNKATELEKDTVVSSANQEPGPPSPPPASQLMTRLFPSLKPKTQNAPLHPPSSAAALESKRPEVETGQQVQSKLLRERLVELEIEIERFKKENAALIKLRQENELQQERLRKDRLEFEQLKADQLAKFEEYKKEENKKLQKERKLFEKHASAVRAMPDKKEREEIQALKQQLNSLQEELRGKESRWAAAQGRMRQQIDTLRQENSSLQEEIHMMEKLRLNTWNDKEKRDAPRNLNSLSVVTKGVKFASPLDSRGSSSSPPKTNTSAPRRTSQDSSQGAAGIKSSLKKPSRLSCSSSFQSSSSLPDKKTEEKLMPPSRNQDKEQNQESSQSCLPEMESLPKEPESSKTEESESVLEVITHPDGKIEKVLAGGDRLISFPNGTRKEVSADGQTVKVTFFNGDTKQIMADQRVIYYYAEAQTTHITYPDATEVLHFPNNQTERLFPDGRKEITFPDQTVKNLYPDGREESVLTDGTIIQVNPDGTKEIHFNTGQKEVHTPDYKRREYPDGTCKTVYTDGRQETRYPTGRLRIKDKDGNVIVDNRV